jgi:hypothetical protein
MRKKISTTIKDKKDFFFSTTCCAILISTCTSGAI